MAAVAPRLVGLTGTVRGTSAEVGERVSLGSAPESTLRIPSPAVSKIHARIVKVEGQYYVEDAGSRNGTFLNGQRVKRFPIRHLDVLTLAPDVNLIFMETGTSRIEAVPPRAIRATITWLDGPLKGRVDELARGRRDIGRSAELPNPGISQKHASLVLTAAELFVEDLGSTNGTFVKGRRITAPTPLTNGDRVSLGQVVDFQVSVLTVASESEAFGVDAVPSQTIVIDQDSTARDAALPELNVGTATNDEYTPPVVPLEGPPPTPLPAPVVLQQESPKPVMAPPAPGPTVLVQREPVKVPRLVAAPTSDAAPAKDTAAPTPPEAPPVTPSAHPATIRPPREAARGVPGALAQRAQAAREIVDATVAANVTRGPDAAPTVPPVSDEAAPPATGRVGAARFEGPQTIMLPRGTFIVGRQKDCPVFLDLRDIGRRHATLIISETGVAVEDMGSANGTFVDDARVTGTAVVTDGATIRFATVEFTVTYVRSEGSDR
jgi:pSer/pThr/pTyr-binding forkhead associated (FHA) protein